MIIRELNQRDREKEERYGFTFNPGDTFKINFEKNPRNWGSKFFQEKIDLLAQDAEEKTTLAKIGVGNSEFHFNEETLKAGYIYDIQIRSQKPNVLKKLWAAMSIHAEERSLSFLFCYLPKNLEILGTIKSQLQPRILGSKVIYLLPTHKSFASSKKIGHFTAKRPATQKRHTLNKAQSGQMDLFPVSPTASFLENYLGEIQGPSHAAKAWDPNNDFCFYLDYPGGFSQILSYISNKDLPIIKRPKTGASIKGWFVYELDCPDEEELLGLLEGTRRRARKKGIAFITVCFDQERKVPGLIEENSWGKTVFDIFFFPITKVKSGGRPTYFHPIFL